MGKEVVDIKDQAKQMYFQHTGATYIAKALNLQRTQVQNWISNGWKDERRLHELETFEDLKAKKTPQLMEILDKSGDIIVRFLKDLLERPESIKPWEMNYVFKAQESVDKIYRLEQNKPTEIIQEERAVDAVELVKKLRKLDPFAKNIEEAKYEEVFDEN
jgi:hypothetical protein